MSSAQNLPNRTRILVKDLLFKEKYALSHTQTDLMAYLVNLASWATTVEDYYVIATSKILLDLPEMAQKTFESSLKALKDLGLIETKIVEVKQWKNKPKLRGVRLSEKGKEYNAHLSLPSSEKEVKSLKEEIKALKETIEVLKKSPKKEETKGEEKEARGELTVPKEEIDIFKEKVIAVFGKTGKAICNNVEGWSNKTTFYINSYHKLALLTPEEQYKQLSNPLEINKFWRWLFNNPQYIGKTIDFSKTSTLSELKERYLNKKFTLEEEIWQIHDILEKEGLVKLQIRDVHHNICSLLDKKRENMQFFDLKRCEEIIWELLE